MRKIRIGNDIAVQWSLVAKGTGEPFVVEGKDIRLSLKSIFATTEIEDFTARGNTIAWTFKGAEQKQTGIYSLVVSVVDAQGAMVTTDVCQFVELVACSCEANGADDAGVQTESIDLVSNVEIGGGGADIDLTDYLTKSDAEETYQPKENIYYFEWDSKVGGGSGELDEATYQAIMAADKVCLKDGKTITEPTIKVKNDADCVYGYVADKRYVLFVSESNYAIIPTSYYDDKEIKENITELSAEVSNKQDTITDLETIRSGAAKGATALQSVPDTYATKTYVDDAIKDIPAPTPSASNEWKCIADRRLLEGEKNIIFTTYADGTPLQAKEVMVQILIDKKAAQNITGYVGIKSTNNQTETIYGSLTYEKTSVDESNQHLQQMRICASPFFTIAEIAPDVKCTVASPTTAYYQGGNLKTFQIYEDIVYVRINANAALTSTAPYLKIYAR